MSSIFVIGSSNTDMVIRSEKLPAPGETILGGEFLMTAGGKGANQAVAAAKLGGKVIFACKVGDDIFGTQAVQNFREVGINTDFICTDKVQPSGVALILVDAKGENSIAVAPGANGNLLPIDLEKVIEQIKPGDIVLIQLEIPISTVAYALKHCHQQGAKVILNPAPACMLDDGLFQYVHTITPNETEAELLTGIKVIDQQSAAEAAAIFIAKGVKTVIITLGAKGAYYHDGLLNKLIPSPAVSAVDSTAAGDVFNGAMAVALTEKMDIEAAVAFACKAAAISVTRMGAQASAPLRSEL
jgi:ribokinase